MTENKKIREQIEERERQFLSPYAALSAESKGRDRYEPEDDIRPVYERDRDRILHCKAFRRLKHKTQVFIAPEGDHYRTRLTHTLEVSQIARTFARALCLNEDLTEAIALGHDLGHTPFGHAGEAVLDRLCIDGFSHVEQSVRVVEVLERDGAGLNLTKEVRDGILNHRSSGHPSTLEGQAVRFADKIAYINHDIDDAIRGGLFREEDIPKRFTGLLGHSVRERLNTMIRAVIFHSIGQPELSMEAGVGECMRDLRKWMFDHVYKGGAAKEEEWKVEKMLSLLFSFYMENPGCMPPNYVSMKGQAFHTSFVPLARHKWDSMPAASSQSMLESGEGESLAARQRIVCDYIAGMTDDYCKAKFQEFFVPGSWSR